MKLITMEENFNYFFEKIKILEGRIFSNKRRSPRTFKIFYAKMILSFVLLTLIGWSCKDRVHKSKLKLKVGVYYFDGWAGKNRKADDPNEPWAKNAPTHLTRRFVEEFPEREPVWGWRDDSQDIMEKQIDLAADNGVEFFLFDWYWQNSNGPINPDAIEKLSVHSSMYLYLKAKNKNRIKFGLLVANHKGAEIKGTENWEKATEYWTQYFKDPQYITLDGRPLVVIFNSWGINNNGIARIQEVAKKQGLPGLSIAGCGPNAKDKNFEYRTYYSIVTGYESGSEEHKYAELVDAHKKQWTGTEKQLFIPELTVGWDKRPVEDKTGKGSGQGETKPGWYYPDRTPEQFKSFLNDAVTWMDEHPTQTTKERFVVIYAWNELGEGGYMVPTKGDPQGSYLKVIKSVVSGK
jgi:hypothetical protein